MASPRPKPTQLKKLAGNPGKRPLNRREPKPPSYAPKCPVHLNAEARSEWGRLVSELRELRLLGSTDRAAMAAYCTAWSRWVEAEGRLAKGGKTTLTPSGYEVMSPWLGIANRAMKQMKDFLIEFGLTPSARTRLKVGPGADESR